MIFSSWKFWLPFFTIFLIYFIHWIRKTKWKHIHKHYPGKKSQLEKITMKYGNANTGGVFSRNIVFSTIEKDGIYLRKPFPLSILMPSIFIPWQYVKELTIVDSIEKLQPSVYRLITILNPNKYVTIKAIKLQDVPIAIKWRESYRKMVPEKLITNL